MGPAIGNVLPMAVGVALSPMPIIAVVLMLGTPRARSNGPAFAIGWVLGLIAVCTLVLLFSNGASNSGSTTSTTTGWIKILFGLVFLFLALKQWQARPKPGAEAEMPKWMATIDTFTPGKSLAIGALLSGVNPKNLALAFAAATSISMAGLSGTDEALAVAVFVILASLTVAGPVVLLFVAPTKAAGWLAEIKAFMAAHNAVIMMVVLLVLGAKLIGDGLSIVTD